MLFIYNITYILILITFVLLICQKSVETPNNILLGRGRSKVIIFNNFYLNLLLVLLNLLLVWYFNISITEHLYNRKISTLVAKRWLARKQYLSVVSDVLISLRPLQLFSKGKMCQKPRHPVFIRALSHGCVWWMLRIYCVVQPSVRRGELAQS